MKLTSILAGAVAYATAVIAIPQGGPISPAQCTFTATPCAPPNGPTETITVYEQPFAVTSTKTYDCHGCTAVAVSPKRCFGVGLPIRTTTFEFLNAQSTTTVDVCSATP